MILKTTFNGTAQAAEKVFLLKFAFAYLKWCSDRKTNVARN